jgi:cysteine desulfurase
LTALRDTFIKELFNKIEHLHLNGHPSKRLPNNINVSIESVDGQSMLLNLDMEAIAASAGSACSSSSLEPSHVLLAMGLSPELAHGSLRLTLGRDTQEEDLTYVVAVLQKIVSNLRSLSPLSKKK